MTRHTAESLARASSHTPLFNKLSCLLISFPHLLVLATSEQFLSAGGTLRAILASESHWLQLMLVLSVQRWPNTNMCGEGVNGGLAQYLRVGWMISHMESALKELVDGKHNITEP